MRSNQRPRRRTQKELLIPPLPKYEPSPKICIKNLPADLQRDELIDIFRQFGYILDAFVKYPAPSSNATYGFVQFVTVQQAATAILALDETFQFGRKIYVAFAKAKRLIDSSHSNPNQCCCSCHAQPSVRVKTNVASRMEANYRPKQELLIGKKRREVESSMISMSPKFSDEEENVQPNRGLKIEEERKRDERQRWEREKVEKVIEKEVVKVVEKEGEKAKGEKAKGRQAEREKDTGQGLLAISTDISKSEISEDYYSYEAKPFSDFCLKREQL